MDLAALKLKLETAKGQLKQAESLLAFDPQNEAFLKLRDDVLRVIKMTDELIRAEENPGERKVAPAVVRDVSLEDAERPYVCGSRVEVQREDIGDKWFAAVVQEEQGMGMFACQLIGYGEVLVTVEASSIRPLRQTSPVDKSQIVKGTKLKALYALEGKFFPAVVSECHADDLYTISWTGFGNKEIVPLEHLRLPEGDGLIAIPDSLKITESDGTRERARKKKRVGAIKFKNKQTLIEREHNSKQKSWKDFVSKKRGKRKKGFNTALMKKDSIFKAPEGGRVGVVGSGQGMTEYSRPKKMRRIDQGT